MFRFSAAGPRAGAALALVALAAGGCGPKAPATVPVAGVVTEGGRPVEGATVTLTRGGGAINAGELAVGKTDARGRFELVTHLGPQTSAPGAVPGEYAVTVSKHVPPPGVTQAQYDAMVAAANKAGETGQMLPPEKQPPPLVQKFAERYSAPGKSTLRATIPETGPVELTFAVD